MPLVHGMRNRWLILGWVLVLLVIYLSLTPNPPPSEFMPSGDKVGHCLEYATLMGWWSQLDARPCRLALLIMFMGLSMELAQSFTDTRKADVFDMAANSVGVGLGWLSTWLKPDWLRRIDGRLFA